MSSPHNIPEFQTPENILEALSYFQEHQLTRFLHLAYDRYKRTGHLKGILSLELVSEQECLELATLLQRPATTASRMTVSLPHISQTLQQSRFQCTLQEVLQAFFREDWPTHSPKERRQLEASKEAQFRDDLQELIQTIPEQTPGHAWLSLRSHWLVSRYKRAASQDSGQHSSILERIRLIAIALNRLPAQEGMTSLAIFAEHLGGDPHLLDRNREEGRLFLKALNDYAQDFTGTTPPEDPLLPQHLHPRELYEHFGLFPDMISSTATLYGLTHATFLDGTPDPSIASTANRIHRLPLVQLREWRHLQSAYKHIYLVENPPVFETLVARLRRASHQPPPLLLCIGGWPSQATRTTLDLLLAHQPDYHFHYNGDFDAKGLKIANWLRQRYPHQFKLWRLDSTSYFLALMYGGRQAPLQALTSLSKLPDPFQEVIHAICTTQKWSYQEGIVHLLAEDMMKVATQ